MKKIALYLTLCCVCLHTSSLFAQKNKARVQAIRDSLTHLFVNELRSDTARIPLLVQYVLYGADIHAATSSGWTLMHEAANQGDDSLLELCFKNRLDVNAVVTYNSSKHSVLHYAIKKKYTAIEQKLRAHGAVLCVPDGYAVLKLDSIAYEGEMRNELRSGRGKAFYVAWGNRYEGMFDRDKRNGIGTFYWKDGRKYEGEWLNGDRHGKGRFSWPNGDEYIGDFKYGDKHGKGVFYGAGGERYHGEWANDQRNGYGVDSFGYGVVHIQMGGGDSEVVIKLVLKHDSSIYAGEWKNGKRNGFGKAWYANGDRYEGYWKDNMRDSTGSMSWKDGRSYIGEWRGDFMEGDGVFTWPGGVIYKGHFLADYRFKYGEMKWPSGCMYSGEWKWDERSGAGELTCPRQPLRWFKHANDPVYNEGYATYKGEWKDDMKNGEGAYYNRDGKLKKKGLFIGGKRYVKPLIGIDTRDDSMPLRSIFIEPVALLDIANGQSVRIGAEYPLYRKWAASATGGVYFGNKQGWMVKGEIKKYIGSPFVGKRYLSAEYAYRVTAYDQTDSIRIKPDYERNYMIGKFVTSVRFKFGGMQLLAHHLFFEYYFGAGIRYRAATSSLTKNEYDNIDYNTDGSLIYPYTSTISHAIRPDITAGIRFGIRY